jgi:hypothetical protein
MDGINLMALMDGINSTALMDSINSNRQHSLIDATNGQH